MLSLVVVVIGFVATFLAVPSAYVGGVPLPHYYPVIPVKSQFHRQNEQGRYAYGYNDGFSSKYETKHANGMTEGAYSYVDPNGVLQHYQYVSDENGYRVTGTNLPAAPSAVSTHQALPKQVEDTPEVAAAKAAHQVAYNTIKAENQLAHDEAEAASQTAHADAKFTQQVAHDAYHGYRPTVYGAYAPAPAPIASYAYASPAPLYAYAHPAPAVLPKQVEDTPEVTAAKTAHQVAYNMIKADNQLAHDEAKTASQMAHDEAGYSHQMAHGAADYRGYQPIAYGAYAAPAPVPSYAYAAPSYAYAHPYSSVHSQYHAQDELGQYSYGYNSGSSSKAEMKTLDGITRGGYSYVDPNGIYQQYQYVSDPVNGFRVTRTNLPSSSL